MWYEPETTYDELEILEFPSRFALTHELGHALFYLRGQPFGDIDDGTGGFGAFGGDPMGYGPAIYLENVARSEQRRLLRGKFRGLPEDPFK